MARDFADHAARPRIIPPEQLKPFFALFGEEPLKRGEVGFRERNYANIRVCKSNGSHLFSVTR
jgi:hypothetical protein